MSILKRLFSWIGLRTNARSRIPKNTELRLKVSQIAEREGRPEHEFVSQLLVAGLQKYYSRKEVVPLWESLSRREKEVAMLIERGMTNKQIAERLSISEETIKTHVANILRKFNVHKKEDIRRMLGVMKTNHWI